MELKSLTEQKSLLATLPPGKRARLHRLLFEVGAQNRARGYRPAGMLAIARCQWRQYRLIRHYPPSS